MVSDLDYVHIPRSFGCTLWGFKNQRFHVYEKDAQRHLDSGGPILATRSLFSSDFVKKKRCFLRCPKFDSPLFLRTTVSLNREPSHVVVWQFDVPHDDRFGVGVSHSGMYVDCIIVVLYIPGWFCVCVTCIQVLVSCIYGCFVCSWTGSRQTHLHFPCNERGHSRAFRGHLTTLETTYCNTTWNSVWNQSLHHILDIWRFIEQPLQTALTYAACGPPTIQNTNSCSLRSQFHMSLKHAYHSHHNLKQQTWTATHA